MCTNEECYLADKTIQSLQTGREVYLNFFHSKSRLRSPRMTLQVKIDCSIYMPSPQPCSSRNIYNSKKLQNQTFPNHVCMPLNHVRLSSSSLHYSPNFLSYFLSPCSFVYKAPGSTKMTPISHTTDSKFKFKTKAMQRSRYQYVQSKYEKRV